MDINAEVRMVIKIIYPNISPKNLNKLHRLVDRDRQLMINELGDNRNKYTGDELCEKQTACLEKYKSDFFWVQSDTQKLLNKLDKLHTK